MVPLAMLSPLIVRDIQDDPGNSNVQPDQSNDGGYFWSEVGGLAIISREFLPLTNA